MRKPFKPVVRIDLRPPLARVTAFTGSGRFREWYCLQHPERGWRKTPCTCEESRVPFYDVLSADQSTT